MGPLLLVLGCAPQGEQGLAQDGYELYSTASGPARPRTVEAVRRVVSTWGGTLPDAERVAALVEEHGRSWRFWARVYAVREDWAHVADELRQRGLPEVLAALPYQTTRYHADLGFADCSGARGGCRCPRLGSRSATATSGAA